MGIKNARLYGKEKEITRTFQIKNLSYWSTQLYIISAVTIALRYWIPKDELIDLTLTLILCATVIYSLCLYFVFKGSFRNKRKSKKGK